MAPNDAFGWVGATLAGKVRIDAVVGEGGFGVVEPGWPSTERPGA